METESNFQKLGANRYAVFSDYDDDDCNTHVKGEKPGRMNETGKATTRHATDEDKAIRSLYNGKYVSLIKRLSEMGKANIRQAPEEDKAIRYLHTGSVIKRIKKLNEKIGKATKRHAPNGSTAEKDRSDTKRNAIDKVETDRFSHCLTAQNCNRQEYNRTKEFFN